VDICQNRCVRRVGGHFERKFQVVCVILRLAILTQCRRVADRLTSDGHTMTANTRASIASRG